MNLGGRTYMPPGVRAFAELAAREGFVAIAVRWFGESYGESYGEAVAELRLRHPGLSGLGKWVWDARRLVDYIGTMPEADAGRIGIIGHSLGGKMSLYAAAFDERITVAVASELGIGLSYSNYDDFWYFGDFIRTVDPSVDHHQLCALIAPPPVSPDRRRRVRYRQELAVYQCRTGSVPSVWMSVEHRIFQPQNRAHTLARICQACHGLAQAVSAGIEMNRNIKHTVSREVECLTWLPRSALHWRLPSFFSWPPQERSTPAATDDRTGRRCP